MLIWAATCFTNSVKVFRPSCEAVISKYTKFVGPFTAVLGTQLHGVSSVAKVHEVDAFYGLSILYIQTGNNSLG